MRILTDDTGLLQHASFSTPNRFHGYCTDDNARALVVALMNWRTFKREDIVPLVHIYMSFLNYAFNDQTQRMRNFMSYNRQWLEEKGSEDSHGRTILALGYAIAYPLNNAILGQANCLFKKAIGATASFTSPRAWAHTILGSMYYLKRFRGDIGVRNVAESLSQRLFDLYQSKAEEGWFWCEEIVAYDNARLPQALIVAGDYFKQERMLNTGLKALSWLIAIQTEPKKGHPTLVGNNGWYKYGKEKARFDQQPLEVSALVDACYQAYLIAEKPYWQRNMERAFSWFFGNNDIGQAVYNFTTGGCYDGLQRKGVNQNQGGESTVSFLLALHQMHQLVGRMDTKVVKKDTDERMSAVLKKDGHLTG